MRGVQCAGKISPVSRNSHPVFLSRRSLRGRRLGAQQIEEVTVTAQRHAENLQDVPMSVATLDTEHVHADLRIRRGHQGDRQRTCPTSTPNPRTAASRRASTSAAWAIPISIWRPRQPVSIIYGRRRDGERHPEELAASTTSARVEVDRGPQGTLFGRNTTAGIIKFTSTKPSQEFETQIHRLVRRVAAPPTSKARQAAA